MLTKPRLSLLQLFLLIHQVKHILLCTFLVIDSVFKSLEFGLHVHKIIDLPFKVQERSSGIITFVALPEWIITIEATTLSFFILKHILAWITIHVLIKQTEK